MIYKCQMQKLGFEMLLTQVVLSIRILLQFHLFRHYTVRRSSRAVGVVLRPERPDIWTKILGFQLASYLFCRIFL